MDWKKLAGEARQVVDKRGGPESVKEDAEELKDIAQGKGTVAEKLKAAAQALKEPGAHEDATAQPQSPGNEPRPSA